MPSAQVAESVHVLVCVCVLGDEEHAWLAIQLSWLLSRDSLFLVLVRSYLGTLSFLPTLLLTLQVSNQCLIFQFGSYSHDCILKLDQDSTVLFFNQNTAHWPFLFTVSWRYSLVLLSAFTFSWCPYFRLWFCSFLSSLRLYCLALVYFIFSRKLTILISRWHCPRLIELLEMYFYLHCTLLMEFGVEEK